MKASTVFLVCVLAAVQANAQQRISVGGEAAVAGDSPWTVHIRTTLFSSGYLRSCAGSLIDERWVLTSARCVDNARFMWLRFGALEVLHPELVTEVSVSAANTFSHPQYNAATGDNNIALVFTNRYVHRTGAIDFAGISTTVPPATGRFCGFGAISRVSGALIELNPGEDLRCVNVGLEQQGEVVVATSNEGTATQRTLGSPVLDGMSNQDNYDDGAPLVVNGDQVGLLVSWPAASGGIVGVFLRPALYLDWISATTGIQFDTDNQVSVIP